MKFVYVDIFGIIHIMIVISYIYYAAETAFSAYCLECFDTVGWHQEEQPVCKNWVMRCWCGCLSGARCRLSAYGPADADISWWYLCQILTDFQNSFTGWFSSKFSVKWVIIRNLTIPCICCHTTLRNINVRKQAINDKLQGTVVTYLRCGELSITKLRNLYCWVSQWKLFFNRWILAKLQARTLLSHALSLYFSSVLTGAHSAWDNDGLVCNFAKYSPV